MALTLMSLVQLARIEAVNHSSQTLLCPTDDYHKCSHNWQQPLMVFIDNNGDETRNQEETIIHIRKGIDNQLASLHWKASGSKCYLRFKANGSTGN